MIFIVILQLLLNGIADSLNWTYNPGCQDDTICGTANMLHVQSKFHQYLWSSQNGLSAIVFSGSNNLSVDWVSYNEDKSAVLVKSPSTLGFTFRSLYLENSTQHNQTIDLTAPSIRWRPLNISNSTSTGNELQFSYTNSFMTVTVNVSEGSGRMNENPKMKITENNTLVDVTLNLSLVPGVWVTQPSLAHLELDVAPAGINDTGQQTSKSFDDEVAPALFRYEILQSLEGNSTTDRVYTMWRPVVYADSEKGARSVISALNTMQINHSLPHTAAKSLLSKFYEDKDVSSLRLVINSPDGQEYIPETIYWTLGMGVGIPQSEGLSLMGSVLTLTIIGLPCAALLLGVAMIVIKRRRSHPGQGYRAI